MEMELIAPYCVYRRMKQLVITGLLLGAMHVLHGQSSGINAMISPNPARDFCEISVSQNVEVRLYDLQGNLVMKPVSGNVFDIDLTSLPYGIYFVHLVGRNEVRTMRLVRAESGA